MGLLCNFNNLFKAVAGVIADARQMVDIARKEATNYRTQYGVAIPLHYLNDRVSMYMHAYTLYSAVRPYGCSVILASYDEQDGPGMYMIDPSGVSYVSMASFCEQHTLFFVGPNFTM